MPAKVDVARRCADIVAALARTANVRLSLKETGVSHFWAYRRRAADPDFRARWDTAVRTGKRALARAAARRARDPIAPPTASTLTLVGSSGQGTLRLEREKPCTFTEAKRAAFLDALRATCNVRAAARATGVSATGAYRVYHADASFRAAWDEALAQGRVHLEMALLGAARALFEAPGEQVHPVVAPKDINGLDAGLALQLLRLHGPRDAAGRARRKWRGAADPEATRAAILAKVAAVRAAREGEGSVGPVSLPQSGHPREGGDPSPDRCL